MVEPPPPTRFWVLKSRPLDSTWHPDLHSKGVFVETVYSEETDEKWYNESPFRSLLAKHEGEILHGRRKDDLVELFEWDDGKETPFLRQQLEQKGLQVITYRREQSPDPETYALTTSGSASESSEGSSPTQRDPCFAKAKQALHKALDEIERSQPLNFEIDYAVLIEKYSKKKPKKRGVVVYRLRLREFHTWESSTNNAEKISFTVDGRENRVLGIVHKGSVAWRRDLNANELMEYFWESKGVFHVNVHLVDEAGRLDKEDEEKERMRMKMEKKMGKIRVEESSSVPELSVQERQAKEEAAKARRMERNRKKKEKFKERKERRREQEEEDESTREELNRFTRKHGLEDAVRLSSEVYATVAKEKPGNAFLDLIGSSDDEDQGRQQADDMKEAGSDETDEKDRHLTQESVGNDRERESGIEETASVLDENVSLFIPEGGEDREEEDAASSDAQSHEVNIVYALAQEDEQREMAKAKGMIMTLDTDDGGEGSSERPVFGPVTPW